MRSHLATPPSAERGHQPGPCAATRLPSCAQNFFTQSLVNSRELSSNARPSRRVLDTSKNRTKRQLLPAACSKNPTAIRPVPMHADRDPRRRRQSSPSHKSRKSQFKQMPTSPRTCAHTWQPLHPPQKGHQPNPHSPPATTRAAFAIHPSAVMRPKFLTQSHTISHNLTHSLAISRVSLVHLYVPFTLQRIGQRDNSYRLPAARIPLRFAQCPCTQTAIRAGAVNHPHHINCANHSSNKCQPALVHALTPVNPFNRRKKASSAARAPLPASALFRPKFLAQSHTISRNLP